MITPLQGQSNNQLARYQSVYPVGACLHHFWETWTTLGPPPRSYISSKKPTLFPSRSDGSDQGIDYHKWSCTSSQEQLPDRSITSTYAKASSRNFQNSEIFRLLQPTFLDSQTKQSLKTSLGPQYYKQFSEDKEIQSGNTRKYEDLPPVRGVGNIHRLPGHLFPHPNTHNTIHKVLAFLCPRSILSVHSPIILYVHIPYGIYSSGEGGQSDGSTQGCKNPTVLRQLVGQSHISPAYTDSSSLVPGTGQDSKHRQIRTGTKHSVGCQFDLREGKVPRSLHPHCKWLLQETNVLQGQPLYPLNHALRIFTDTPKKGCGTDLGEHTARGTWFIPEGMLHINYLELKAFKAQQTTPFKQGRRHDVQAHCVPFFVES